MGRELVTPLLVFSPGIYSVDVDTQISATPGVAVLADLPSAAIPGRIQAEATTEFVDVGHEVSMQPNVATVQITTDAPNTALISDPRPDVRGELLDLTVIDVGLADLIAEGELKLPAA